MSLVLVEAGSSLISLIQDGEAVIMAEMEEVVVGMIKDLVKRSIFCTNLFAVFMKLQYVNQ